MAIATRVLGPAYLDRIVRVDGPLAGPAAGAPLDQSVEGVVEFADGLRLVDAAGSTLEIDLPPGWTGPTGTVRLGDGPTLAPGRVAAIGYDEDLGGMGAGFAKALGGTLTSVLGPVGDPVSDRLAALLTREGIPHHPVRVDHIADRTLLVTSGPHGDKLPIGLRGAHRAWDAASAGALAAGPTTLRVVAGLPNPIAAEALRAPGARVRLFAPAVRNMVDRDCPLTRFAEPVDLLCCNLREWSLLDGREQVAWVIPVLAITDGPNGSVVRFTRPDGDPGRLAIPAFPRSRPPRDTNRAGEAYAATLATALIAAGWTSGVIEPEVVRAAAVRASAAAALVLDRTGFGFPTDAEIDAALAAGCVA